MKHLAVELECLFQLLVYHRHHVLLGVQPGFGIRDERCGIWVWGLGFIVEGLGSSVRSLGFGVHGLGFMV